MLIRQQFATKSTKVSKGTNGRRYITIHETANTQPGADAAAHAGLQATGNVRDASWHWQVDDTEAIQSFRHTARCWHAGDGSGPGNADSIAIEICVNRDGNYTRAITNAAELARRIMTTERIPVSRVVQHNHWSGKDCPNFLRDGSKGPTWATFLSMLTDQGDDMPAFDDRPEISAAARDALNDTNPDWQTLIGYSGAGGFTAMRDLPAIRAALARLEAREPVDPVEVAAALAPMLEEAVIAELTSAGLLTADTAGPVMEAALRRVFAQLGDPA